VRVLPKTAFDVFRRTPFFPQSMPDKIGEDAALEGSSLDAEILLFFPDAPEALYQLEPWYEALMALHAEHPLVVVCQDSRAARAIAERTGLPVRTIARYGTLDALLGRSRVRVALYVNHNSRNFECLRYTSLLHAYIGHGDSDKGVSASNQLKAYDVDLVAGRAAVDRVAENLVLYDAETRCIVVGQPMLDGAGILPAADAPPPTPPAPDARITVLYAPTWEGGQPSTAYSSLETMGVELVRSLVAEPGIRVVFRPHPITGLGSPAASRAEQEVRALLVEAAAARLGSGHVTETSGSISEAFRGVDVLVTDVSAVSFSWLPTLRPQLITRPRNPGALEASVGMLAVLPRLDRDEAPDAAVAVRAALADPDAPAARAQLVDYYVAHAREGEATLAFVAACGDLVARRDALDAGRSSSTV
jgi:hypothetical protein